MTPYLTIAAVLVVILTARAILRAPLGFQTDSGFFYGLPHDEQRGRKRRAKTPWSVGGGADPVVSHLDFSRINRENDHA